VDAAPGGRSRRPTDAVADVLTEFAAAYTQRGEPEGAELALASLVRLRPETAGAANARERLGGNSRYLGGDNPVPDLLARIDRMREDNDRRQVPRTVSARDASGTAWRSSSRSSTRSIVRTCATSSWAASQPSCTGSRG
jgi:hypothetical protein